MKQKKSYSNLSVKKPAQVNWAAVHRLENPMVYTGLCMRPGILTIHLQGGQLMEHTLKLSKSGSSGGKGDSPKSGIIPLQGCPLASKEQGPARAWGTYQYCFCLPQCISPGWPCQQVTDILKKVILLSSLSSPALLKKKKLQTKQWPSDHMQGMGAREGQRMRKFLEGLILLSTQKTRKTERSEDYHRDL